MDKLSQIKIYLVVAMLFLISGAGLFLFSSKKNDAELKIKYWIYIAIVFSFLIMIQNYLPGFYVLSGFIILLGLYEILRLNPFLKERDSGFLIYPALTMFFLICIAYIGFIFLSQKLILFTYFTVILFDGFSQLFGVLAGKRKMMKQLSPGKTWEGFAGGITGTILIIILFRNNFPEIEGNLYIRGLAVIAFAFTGDVTASWLKRKAGVKDYSRLIPGHGGVLDRFDSFLMAGASTFVLQLVKNL